MIETIENFEISKKNNVAYDKFFLRFVTNNIGEMCEFAVKVMGYPLDLFLGMFAKSFVGKRLGEGDPIIMNGKVGTELAYEVEREFKGCIVFRGHEIPGFSKENPIFQFGRSLAYCQWYMNRSYEDILSYATVYELFDIYLSMKAESIDLYCQRVAGLITQRTFENSIAYVSWQSIGEYEMEKKRLCLE